MKDAYHVLDSRHAGAAVPRTFMIDTRSQRGGCWQGGIGARGPGSEPRLRQCRHRLTAVVAPDAGRGASGTQGLPPVNKT